MRWLKGVWIGLQRLCSSEKESVFSVSLVYSQGAKQLRTPSLEEKSCLAGDGPVTRDFAKGLEVMDLRSRKGRICWRRWSGSCIRNLVSGKGSFLPFWQGH